MRGKLSWGNYPGGQFFSGVIILEANCPGGNNPGDNHPGENCPGGNFPLGQLSGHSFQLIFFACVLVTDGRIGSSNHFTPAKLTVCQGFS